MIYEWYSGSDKKGKVPRGIRTYSYVAEDLKPEERLSLLNNLLARERDPNWRGYLKHYIGTQYIECEKVKEAALALEAALQEFDPFAGNFGDVVEQYARTLLYLVREHYISSDDVDTTVGYILRVLPHIDKLDEEERFQTFSLAAEALGVLASKLRNMQIRRASLDFDLAAHHLEPENPASLEGIIYTYVGLADLGRAKLAYRQFESLDVDYEYRDRVDDFCKKAFSGKYVVDEGRAST